MPAHAGADTPPVYSRRTAYAVWPLRRWARTEIARVGGYATEQVHVVGFAVELDQLDIELVADLTHGALGEGEHGVGEHPAAVFGHEHQVCVQQRHAVPVAAVGRVGRGCQCPPLRLCCG